MLMHGGALSTTSWFARTRVLFVVCSSCVAPTVRYIVPEERHGRIWVQQIWSDADVLDRIRALKGKGWPRCGIHSNIRVLVVYVWGDNRLLQQLHHNSDNSLPPAHILWPKWRHRRVRKSQSMTDASRAHLTRQIPRQRRVLLLRHHKNSHGVRFVYNDFFLSSRGPHDGHEPRGINNARRRCSMCTQMINVLHKNRIDTQTHKSSRKRERCPNPFSVRAASAAVALHRPHGVQFYCF